MADDPTVIERSRKTAGESAGIDFLDFLFTFALGFGLVPEAFGKSGPLSEGWFEAGRQFADADRDKIAVLILGILTLTLSWFGYHASIRRQPLDLKKLSGLFRFQLDVLLVLLYGLILINFRNTGFVVGAIVFIFYLFFVWDLLKAEEAGESYMCPYDERGASRWLNYRRDVVTVIWGILIALCTVLYWTGLFQILWWSLLAIVISVLYRVHKVKGWEPLEKRLRIQTCVAPKKST